MSSRDFDFVRPPPLQKQKKPQTNTTFKFGQKRVQWVEDCCLSPRIPFLRGYETVASLVTDCGEPARFSAYEGMTACGTYPPLSPSPLSNPPLRLSLSLPLLSISIHRPSVLWGRYRVTGGGTHSDPPQKTQQKHLFRMTTRP